MTTATFQPGLSEVPELGSRRTIPFDYAFRYKLNGERDRVVNDTVTVSIEATFVARLDRLRCDSGNITD